MNMDSVLLPEFTLKRYYDNHYVSTSMIRHDFEGQRTFCETTTAPEPKSESGSAGEPRGPNGGLLFKPSKPLPCVDVRTGDDTVPSKDIPSERISFPDGSLERV